MLENLTGITESLFPCNEIIRRQVGYVQTSMSNKEWDTEGIQLEINSRKLQNPTGNQLQIPAIRFCHEMRLDKN